MLYAGDSPVRGFVRDDRQRVIAATEQGVPTAPKDEGTDPETSLTRKESDLDECLHGAKKTCTGTNFASDTVDGLSSCPTAINVQLSLLACERAREVEHEIFASIQKIMFSQARENIDFESFMAVYCTLTLMVDAYESYAIAFEVNAHSPYYKTGP